MHLPGKKNTTAEISEPVEVRRMEDQTFPYTADNIAEAGPTGTHRDLARVYQDDANQSAGANTAQDPRRGLEEGQQPTGMASTLQDTPDVQVGEDKLPFKEQVRAYHKIHRGTLLGDRELKEKGEKILAGETPPQ